MPDNEQQAPHEPLKITIRPLPKTPEEWKQYLQRLEITNQLSPEEATRRAQEGASLLNGQGVDPVGDSLIDLTTAAIDGIDALVHEALMREGFGKVVRVYFKHVGLAGEITEFILEVEEEIDENGNIGYRAQMVAGANVAGSTVAAFTVNKAILLAITRFITSQPSLLVVATVAAGSAILGSKLYESTIFSFNLKDFINNKIREAYNEQTNQQKEPSTTDVQQQTPASTPNNEPSSPTSPSPQIPDASGGLLASVGDFFMSAADRIGDRLGLGNNGSLAAIGGPGFGFGRIGFDPGSIERLLSQGIEKFTDKVADRLIKNDNIMSNALGRTLTQNSGLFGNLLKQSRLGDISSGFGDFFSANNLGGIIGSFAGNAIDAGFNRLLGGGRVRTSVSSQESDRSRQAQANYSQAQQAALLAQWLERGNRNM